MSTTGCRVPPENDLGSPTAGSGDFWGSALGPSLPELLLEQLFLRAAILGSGRVGQPEKNQHQHHWGDTPILWVVFGVQLGPKKASTNQEEHDVVLFLAHRQCLP